MWHGQNNVCKQKNVEGISLRNMLLGQVFSFSNVYFLFRATQISGKICSCDMSWPTTVLKLSGAIFRPASSKPSLQLFFPCPFHCKPRPSRVSLESLGLGNIIRVHGNQAKVGQNQGARKAVSATFSVLKLSGAIFRPACSSPSVQLFFPCRFHLKPRSSRLSLESLGLGNIVQVLGNQA